MKAILNSFALVISKSKLNDGSLALADESEVDELTNLTYKVEGTYQGEPAEYWYRFKDIGTEEEYVRFDVSPLESEETRIVILNKKNKKVIYKEMGSDSWLEGLSMMFSLIWSRYREGAISRYVDAED
ncbi:hypothetical protein K9M78_08135 [Candidatus Bipolaricaulota bacterium]|nr:hypothetical protein [Candidatus Bipolaricaulota bacterium]